MKKVTIKKRLLNLSLITLLFFAGLGISNAQEPMLGEIKMFIGNFAPKDWALCNGQIIPVNENAALFSLIGTTYGGDGVSTFGLPDLRGRAPIHAGRGAGLTIRRLGGKSGAEKVALAANELPSHNHAINVSNEEATTDDPTGAFHAKPNYSDRGVVPVMGYGTSSNSKKMAATSIGNTGTNAPVYNMQPYLVVNFIIALEGYYPSRN